VAQRPAIADSKVYNDPSKGSKEYTMTRSRHRAVLTGDIIGSSRLEPRQLQSVRASLARAVEAVKGWKRGLVHYRLEFFRGDGWQFLLTDPAAALRTAVYLRASLRATGLADSRIAIGLGEVDRTSPGRVSLSTGQAFVLSGRALDRMDLYSRMTIAAPDSAGDLADWLPVIGHLCDSLIGQWTRRQAEVVRRAIVPGEPDYEAIARSLKPPVSKQAVAKGLRGANWHVLREAIHRFEDTSWHQLLPAAPPDNQKRLSQFRQPKMVVQAGLG